MKEVTLRISDKKLPFFLELVQQLGLEVVKEDRSVPQWQQEQVRLAMQEIEAGTADLLEWESLKNELFEKYNVK
jgi:hypothetical protein